MKRNLIAVLTACLLLTALWGCQKDPATEPTPTPTQGPQTIVNVPGEGELPETKNVTVDGHEAILTLVTGSFQRTGGPDFALYVDKNQFQVNDVDGCCYITTEEGSTYAEIGFCPETDGETLAPGFLREYGNIQDESDMGEETFGNNTARRLAGRTMDSAFEAYLVDTDGGCLTMVVCSPMGEGSPISSTETDAARLVDALRELTLS